MSTDNVLAGDVAIVTGAGRNIGQAIAKRLGEAGAKVAVADLSEERAEDTVELIESAGQTAMSVVVDVTEEDQVTRMVEAVEAEFGQIDVLVNNAAVMEDADFLDLSLDEFAQVLEVILHGSFLCTREVAKSMKESGGGRIVNLGSTSAHKGRPDAPAYGTAKSGILNFTRSAAKALAPYDIRVNTLSPTRTGPKTFKPSIGEKPADAASNVETDEEAEAFRQQIPLGRLGRPEDHANGVLFLVSPESEFVTGTELLVDGGRSA